MRPRLLLVATLLWYLETSGVMSYVVGPLKMFNTRTADPNVQSNFKVETDPSVQSDFKVATDPTVQTKPKVETYPMVHSDFTVETDDSIIYFPRDDEQHTRLKRSVSEATWDYDNILFPDLYPQTSLQNERVVRQDEFPIHGPQNGWGNAPRPGGNQGFNNPRQQNRPNASPNFQPNWGNGGNRPSGNGGNSPWGNGGNSPWGNGGASFNRPDEDDDDQPFVFDRPPVNGGGRPQNGGGRPQNGGGRPQNGGGRPQNGGGRPQNGGGRPQNGGGGGGRPRPGNGGGRPSQTTQSPTTRPTTTSTPTTSRPRPGGPVTTPTPAPTRPNCNCPSTPEFNPVCGQDKVTYSNPGKLRCANYCGNNVQMSHFGACITTTTAPPPSG